MQLLLILLLMASLAAMAVPAVQRGLAERRVARRLARYCRLALPERDAAASAHPFYRALLGAGRVLAGSGSSAAKLTVELRAAGWVHRDAAALFSGGRMLGALVLGALAALVFGAKAGALVLGFAWVLPGILLSRRASSRTLRMRAELPSAIDVLVMVLEGGAGVEQALRFSVGLVTHPSPLCQRAFRGFVQDLERGTPYELALMRLSDRLLIDEGQLFVEVLRQALTHGTELQEPLKTLARDLRQRRLADARAAIGKATISMTVVMVSCLLPVLLAIITAPPLSGVLQTLRNMSR